MSQEFTYIGPPYEWWLDWSLVAFGLGFLGFRLWKRRPILAPVGLLLPSLFIALSEVPVALFVAVIPLFVGRMLDDWDSSDPKKRRTEIAWLFLLTGFLLASEFWNSRFRSTYQMSADGITHIFRGAPVSSVRFDEMEIVETDGGYYYKIKGPAEYINLSKEAYFRSSSGEAVLGQEIVQELKRRAAAAVVLAPAHGQLADDLSCHHTIKNGKRVLNVSQEQWATVKTILQSLDRKRIEQLLPKGKVILTAHQEEHGGIQSHRDGVTKRRFLDGIGKPTDYDLEIPAFLGADRSSMRVFRFFLLATVAANHKRAKERPDGARWYIDYSMPEVKAPFIEFKCEGGKLKIAQLASQIPFD